MDESDIQIQIKGVNSAEVFSICGFALCVGYMFLAQFWLFIGFPSAEADLSRRFVQMWVFAGVVVGSVVAHAMGNGSPKYTPFNIPFMMAIALSGALLPCCAVADDFGVVLPTGLYCFFAALSGFAIFFLILDWLDVCSRLRTKKYGRFMGLSLLVGVLLIVPAFFVSSMASSLLALVYLVAGVLFCLHANVVADANHLRAPKQSLRAGWEFTKEIEPSFLIFEVVFGMSFAWVFFIGSELSVILALLSIIPGAFCVAVPSMLNKRMEITVILRGILVVCVFSCLFMPLFGFEGRLVLCCIVIAGWTMFTGVNYSFLVKKSLLERESPLYRQIPVRLISPFLGFFIGWLLVVCLTYGFGLGSLAIGTARTVVATGAVAVFVFFFPIQDHHTIDGSSISLYDDEDLFNQCIQNIAQDYKLSPRETDVFRYLARGRNAAYIQEQLVISPHTVKTHMQSIYRKLGVHSQQKLMDIVDAYKIAPNAL